MDRKSSNASDIFSKYLNPLEDKGETSKDSSKKRTLPPTLPRKQLVNIDEYPKIELNGDVANRNEQLGITHILESTSHNKKDADTTYDEPENFDPRKFNANYNGTIKDPHYKTIVPGNGEENEGSPNFTRRQFPPPASGPNSKHDLGFTEPTNRSLSKNMSLRMSSIRDIVEIRKRINDQVTQRKDGTINRYIYLDRGNTWCLRICLFFCILFIIILLILVSQNAKRLSALEGI